MSKSPFFLLSFLVSFVLCGAPHWIWYPEGTPSTAFRKTVTLDEEVKSAVFHMACDGRGLLYVNGKMPFTGTTTPWLNLVVLKTQRYDLTHAFTAGENVFALSAWPGEEGAAFICKGEIVLKSGKTIPVDSDSGFVTFDRESFRVKGEELWQSRNPRNWNLPGFDSGKWKPAKELGSPDMEQYRDKLDPTLLRRDDHYSVDPARQGRFMLDDFADISSWLGGPRRGHQPSATRPVYFSFGSIPAPERDDGYCGEIRFAFQEKNGIAGFAKNAIYQTWAVPAAITFAADPGGHDAALAFEFEDKSGKRFVTKEIALDHKNGWSDYRFPFDRSSVPDFGKITFPVAMRNLLLRVAEPAGGSVRVDDLAYLADVSNPRKQIDIRSEYRGLSHAPDTEIQLDFRVRNALLRNTDCKLTLRIYSPEGELVREQKDALRIPAGGIAQAHFSFKGFSRLGPYRIELTGENGEVKNTFSGWLGVFVPNNGRLNKSAMWFGIEDQEFHTAPYEVQLHAQWMKLLGVDLLRGIIMGGAAQYEQGATAGLEAFSRLWQPHFNAGLDLLLDYAADVPPWTISETKKKNDRNWYRNQMSDLPEMLSEHIRDVAKFMNAHPQIKYFEWLNEPDLNGFRGTADEYIASLKLIYPIIRQYAPKVKVTTGGMVVTHPYGKVDFSRRVYQECADCYDVAAFHCHDDINAYKRYQAAIEKYVPGKPVANTEAGSRSYLSAPSLFFNQAVTLVKKISFAKSRNSEFYIWFMLQDYWDKYVNADDSFGLVTVDNQPKPSFLAYNELIRQLSNTVPAAELAIDPRLETLRFRRGDRDVFVCWPRRNIGKFPFALKTDSEFTLIDMFGNTTTVHPQNGVAMLAADALPFYLSAPHDAIQPGILPLAARGDQLGIPGKSGRYSFTLSNPLPESTRMELTVGAETIAHQLPPGGTVELEVPLTIPANALPGSNCSIPTLLKIGKTELPVMLQIPVALPCFPVGSAAETQLTLDSAECLTELAFDPVTPRWSGPEDLSAVIRLQHDNGQLLFDIKVRDQEHCVPFTGINNWKNDSVQVALATADGKQITELTVSGSGDGPPIVWRHIAPVAEKTGRWDIPVQVTREKAVTHYQFTVPLKETGIAPATGTKFRISLLINDNDGGKRLRLMEFCGGIENSKAVELFGWAQIQ